MTALPPLLPIFKAEDAAGASLPFALIYTYAAGTTTPLATYQDAAGTIPNSNPIVCDANGLAIVYLTTGVAYKLLLTDQYGTLQPRYPVDDIVGGATGLTGAPGSVWRNGAGVPSNAVGVDGDFYLNDTNGDVYKRSGGIYAVIANIIGPAGSARNVISNGTFYGGLEPWITSGTTTPTLGVGHLATLGAAQEIAAQSTSVTVTSVGSITQSFTAPNPVGTQLLTFNTACYLESLAAALYNTGYVKVYFYSATDGTETLIGTYNLSAVSNVPSWTPHTIDLTTYVTALGDYGLRFEIQAYTDNTTGTIGTKGTITAVDDINFVMSSGGSVGPIGPEGPAGPGVGLGVATSYSMSSTPTGTTSGTLVMMGLGTIIRFTPSLSTRVFISLQGTFSNTDADSGTVFGVCYGTGTAPINGAASPGGGTLVGASGPSYVRMTSPTANAFCHGCITYIVTGLTPGASYWFDYALANITSGTASVVSPFATIFEM
jgi:hypothetical protein